MLVKHSESLRGIDMTDNMLDAIATTVRMVRGAYTWPEALSYAAIEFDLDEFQIEDLDVIARRQYNRIKAQTGE